jgi:hypothetical protein
MSYMLQMILIQIAGYTAIALKILAAERSSNSNPPPHLPANTPLSESAQAVKIQDSFMHENKPAEKTHLLQS